MQDWMSKLERAKALLDVGAITQDEFAAEKARLLPRAYPTNRPGQDSNPVEEYHGHPKQSQGELDVSETIRRFSPLNAAIAVTLAFTIAIIGYLVFNDETSQPLVTPTQEQAMPTPPATSHTGVERAASKPAAKANPSTQQFSCVGAYSEVSFSEDSGDGSGLFVRISKSGQVKWLYYEGGVSRGEVAIERLTKDSIDATVRYPDYPEQPPSPVGFRCNSGKLSVKDDSGGWRSLRQLNEMQAAELDP